MVLVWLEADMLIHEASNGTRSLDDFARAFFGVAPGSAGSGFAPLTYTFADVVAALDAVQGRAPEGRDHRSEGGQGADPAAGERR